MRPTKNQDLVEMRGNRNQIGEVSVRPEEILRDYGRLRLACQEALTVIRRSLARQGQQTPAVVLETPAGYQLLDGFKRVQVATELGIPQIRCQVVSLSPREAKIAMVSLNRPTSGLTEMEEAWIVRALHQEDGLTLVEIGKQLTQDKAWVSRRLAMAVRLVAVAQDAIRLGLLSPTAARSLVLLPRGNQEKLFQAHQRESLSTREMGQVARLLREADSPEIQRAILLSPRGAIARSQRMKKEKEKGAKSYPAKPKAIRLRERMLLLQRVGGSLGRELATEIQGDPECLKILAREGPLLVSRLTWLLSLLQNSLMPLEVFHPPGPKLATRSSTSSLDGVARDEASPESLASPGTQLPDSSKSGSSKEVAGSNQSA